MTENYNDSKQIQVDLAWQFLRHLDLGTFDYADTANLLHSGFQGVRWTRDQPMPGVAQHQYTDLLNNQFPESKILGVPVSPRMCALVYTASRDKVDVDTFHKSILYALEKTRKVEIWLWRNSSIKQQKTRGLWERDCWLFQSSVPWCWSKGTWALGTRLAMSRTMMQNSSKYTFLDLSCKVYLNALDWMNFVRTFGL